METSPKQADPRWTSRDAARAMEQGWGLFNVETGAEIQRIDEVGVFEEDDDAVAFVRALAIECKVARKALVIAGLPALSVEESARVSERSARVAQALERYAKQHGYEPELIHEDFLADFILHCARKGLAFELVLRSARNHASNELTPD